jgi:hydroxymethylpyrimidine pyrophosphatase-like HAD family hydrolase
MSFCTGRGPGYTEAIGQAYLGDLVCTDQRKPWPPSICESGGILFDHFKKETIWLVDRGTALQVFPRLELEATRKIKGIKIRPKITMATFNPPMGESVEETYNSILEIAIDLGFGVFDKLGNKLAKGKPELVITHSKTAIDVTLREADKWKGVQEATKLVGLGLDEVAFIGDSFNDLPVLEKIETGFLVQNAPDELKAMAKDLGITILDKPYFAGVKQAIDLIVRENKNERGL